MVYDQAQEQTLCVEVCGGEGSGKVDGDVGKDVWGHFWDGFDGGGIEFGELAFEIGFVHLEFFETFGRGFSFSAEVFEESHQIGYLFSDRGKPRFEVEPFFRLFDEHFGGIRFQLFVGGEEVIRFEGYAGEGGDDRIFDGLAWDAAFGAVAFAIGAGAKITVVGLAAFLWGGATEEGRAAMGAATDAAEEEA